MGEPQTIIVKTPKDIRQEEASKMFGLLFLILLIGALVLGIGYFILAMFGDFLGTSLKTTAIILVVFVVGIFILIKFRKKIFSRGVKTKNDWERIRHVPNWVHRKMKRRRTNKVNGEHYVYLKREGKYYRLKKHG